MLEYARNQETSIIGKEEQVEKKIRKLVKVVRALTQLALEIGTLTAVIKMIIESLR